MKAKPNIDAKRAVTRDLGRRISTDFVTRDTLFTESNGDLVDVQIHPFRSHTLSDLGLVVNFARIKPSCSDARGARAGLSASLPHLLLVDYFFPTSLIPSNTLMGLRAISDLEL